MDEIHVVLESALTLLASHQIQLAVEPMKVGFPCFHLLQDQVCCQTIYAGVNLMVLAIHIQVDRLGLVCL